MRKQLILFYRGSYGIEKLNNLSKTIQLVSCCVWICRQSHPQNFITTLQPLEPNGGCISNECIMRKRKRNLHLQFFKKQCFNGNLMYQLAILKHQTVFLQYLFCCQYYKLYSPLVFKRHFQHLILSKFLPSFLNVRSSNSTCFDPIIFHSKQWELYIMGILGSLLLCKRQMSPADNWTSFFPIHKMRRLNCSLQSLFM